MKDVIHHTLLVILGVLLLGYAVGDRGFAHIGVPPLYVGEFTLLICLTLFLAAADLRPLFRSATMQIVLVLDVWCLIQTIPYVEIYEVDTLRDSAVYGYSIFAVILAGVLFDPHRIRRACAVYARVAPFAVIAMLFVLLSNLREDGSVLDEELPLFLLKAGDAAVHVIGFIAFELLGLRAALIPTRGIFYPNVVRVSWFVAVAILLWSTTVARGSIMDAVMGFGVLAAFGFSRRQLIRFGAGVAAVILVFGVLDIGIKTDRRDVSSAQLIDNATSIIGVVVGVDKGVSDDLAGTANWRLSWWSDILSYTMFGPYFWSGKGFGVNLADSDGYQVWENDTLRSPHSGHFTFLARAGVPGLALWLAFLASFVIRQIRMARQLAAHGLHDWSRLNFWILSYWVAAVVNGSFDVYLEGPQGGIWFWCLTGFGIVLVEVQRGFFKPTRG